MVDQVIAKKLGDLVVTPKDIDAIVESVASVLADGINLAVHDGIPLEEMQRYIH